LRKQVDKALLRVAGAGQVSSTPTAIERRLGTPA